MEKSHCVRNPLCLIAHHTAFLHKENYTAKRCSVGISDAYQAVDFVLKKYKVDRLFYTNLSKLALVKAIETDIFETASAQQNASADLGNACLAVSDDSTTEAVDSTTPTEKLCVAFVTACEPPRQGSGLHISNQSGIKPQYGLLGSKKEASQQYLKSCWCFR